MIFYHLYINIKDPVNASGRILVIDTTTRDRFVLCSSSLARRRVDGRILLPFSSNGKEESKGRSDILFIGHIMISVPRFAAIPCLRAANG